ncbi:Apical endosomal glycoprotein [Manis javanica]|nr:Apical endosomal glycoprotein [Manis javanica]
MSYVCSSQLQQSREHYRTSQGLSKLYSKMLDTASKNLASSSSGTNPSRKHRICPSGLVAFPSDVQRQSCHPGISVSFMSLIPCFPHPRLPASQGLPILQQLPEEEKQGTMHKWTVATSLRCCQEEKAAETL